MEFSNYSLGRDDHCYKKTREEKRKSERRRDVCEWREGEKRANHSVSSKKKTKAKILDIMIILILIIMINNYYNYNYYNTESLP